MLRPLYILAILMSSSPAFASVGAETKVIHGGVQFWRRLCNESMRCELPKAIGPVHSVHGSIQAPASASTVGYFSETVIEGDIKAEMQFFWKVPTSELPHLVFQQRLIVNVDGQWRPVSECSSYTGIEGSRAFPVGACSGYQSNAPGYVQWGVTFIKAN